MIVFITGCGSTDASPEEDAVNVNDEAGEPAGDLFAGTSAELLQSIIDEANASLPEVYIDTIMAENAPAILGLLSDDFASFISDGAVAAGESDSVAFQAAVVICRYEEDAVMIDGLIREGFDPGKWGHVFPDRSLTAVLGSYVLLAAGSEAETQALTGAFEKAIGGSAIMTVFYEGETGG